MSEGINPENISSGWYVIYTYSGYENKVKATLEKLIANRGLQDKIEQIVIPMEEEIEIKDEDVIEIENLIDDIEV